MAADFKELQKSLQGFDLSCFSNSKKVDEYCEIFGIRRLCAELEFDRTSSHESEILQAVSVREKKPYGPKWGDLCRLHWLQMSRKGINVLEFGSGYSTAVFGEGARLLSEHFGDSLAGKLRSENPFHVYSIEEEQRFMEITQARLGKNLSKYVTLSRSSVELILFEGRIATIYSKIPNVNPDIIYLDGPSQYATTQTINGFSLCSPTRMPMSADILRIEFFLEPGTLIIVDGRTANARFLKAFLKRNWLYYHDVAGDVHYFELHELPLGYYNERKIEFCLNNKWLLPRH